MKRKQSLLGTLGIVLLMFATSPLGQARAGRHGLATTGPAPTQPTTLLVTSPADSGPGTLRQALLDAVAGDTITFDPAVFPPASPVPIAVTSARLPDLDQGNLTIDASNAGVILDGAGLSDPEDDGLVVASDGNTIRGLQILHFPRIGLHLVAGAYNTIGGDSGLGSGPVGQGNVIGGNGDAGIYVGAVHDNVVAGNYIGTDASGTAAVPNGAAGVTLSLGATHNSIGGETPGQRNVISGNTGDGVRVDGWGSDSNEIVGNYIGLAANGLDPLGNGSFGFWLYQIDGTLLDGNLIAANAQGGVFLATATHTTVRANRIGVNAAGEAAGNGALGLWLGYFSDHNVIGGPDPADGNVIAYNADVGVQLWDGGTATYANTISHNSIYAHSREGIELLAGTNQAIVRPVVTAADPAAGQAGGTACPDCAVEVFSSDDDEGRWYEGSTTAGGDGSWSFARGSAFSGLSVQATATDAAGNTSEFSGPPPAVDSAAPASAAAGTAGLGVTIYGSSFQDNEPLLVSLGPGIAVTGTEFLDSTTIHTYLTVDAAASTGPRDVVVTNYDGQSGTATGAFTVTAVSPFPPPLVEAITPTLGLQGQRLTLTVDGQGFVDRPTASLSGGDITVIAVTTISSTRLLVDLAISDAALPAWHDLTVTNPDGQGATLAPALEVQVRLFSDVSFWAGIGTDGQRGVAWGDYDGDGYEDLFVTNPATLYHNQGNGTFQVATSSAGIGYAGGEGVAWADYDNDGDLDVYTSDWGNGDSLLRNEGNGTFVYATLEAGLYDPGHGQAVAWADYDGDGDVDLYMANAEGDPNLLFRNNGDGTFADVTAAAGVSDNGQSQSAAWGDYNNDGLPDLYVTNASSPDRLFENQGDGTFVDRAEELGVTASAYGNPTGAAWGDYDDDGDLDLAISADGTAVLYRNDGQGFADVTAGAGVGDSGVGNQAAAWADYDNDGWLDLYISGSQGSILFHNQGDGSFADVTGMAGLATDRNWGAAWADYDRDGDLDLFVVRGGMPELGEPDLPDALFRNNGNGNHWLQVRLAGTTSNRSAIGARVRLVAAGLSQIRQVSGGSGRTSQDSLPVELGLGDYYGPVTVEVTWPSGVVDTMAGVAVDQLLTLTETAPALRDMAVVSVSPGGEVPLDEAVNVRATIRNVGAQPETGVPVTCTIEHAAATVYQETLLSGEVEPGTWAGLNFPAYVPGELGAYTLTCQSALAGDQEPINDVRSQSLAVVAASPDVWTKDNPADNGDIPSGEDDWYVSPDVWVRHQADGGLVHQEPIAGVQNTVYVRLRNRGNAPLDGSVDLYWIEPSLGVRCGDWAYINTIAFANLAPGEVRIVSVGWVPTRSGHTCLQSIVDSDTDPYDRGLECAPQWIPWDNNASWRNLEILENPGGGRGPDDQFTADVQLANVYDRPQNVDLIVERRTFPLAGTATIQLPPDLFDRWRAYGQGWGQGIEVDEPEREIRVTGAVSATVGAIPLLAGEQVTVGLRFDGQPGLEFELAVRERIGGLTTGGVVYQWIIPDTTPPAVVATTPSTGAESVAPESPIVVTFSEPMGPLSLQLALAPDPGGWSTAWNEAGTVVTATHAALLPVTVYSAAVVARDAAGNALPLPYTWSFTTSRGERRIYLPIIIRR